MSKVYKMNIDEIEKYIIGKKIKDMSLEEIRNFIAVQGNTIILNHHIYEKQRKEIEKLKTELEIEQDINDGMLETIDKAIEYIESEKVIKEDNTIEKITNYEKKLLEILKKENK